MYVTYGQLLLYRDAMVLCRPEHFTAPLGVGSRRDVCGREILFVLIFDDHGISHQRELLHQTCTHTEPVKSA